MGLDPMSEMPARIWADMHMGIWLGVPQPDRRPEPPIEFVRADIAERMAEALARLIQTNEEHNAAISRIVRHPIGWKDDYLNESRSALSAWKNGR
jgi:hypothetical protein